MDLEEIKSYDDSLWLYFLKQRTVFDTDNIKSQKDWLIQQVEELNQTILRYEKALNEIDNIVDKSVYSRTNSKIGNVVSNALLGKK